jgi:hypothetical protein
MSTTRAAGTLRVTSLTDSAGDVVDRTTAGARDQAPGQVVPLTATKTWIAGGVIVPPPPRPVTTPLARTRLANLYALLGGVLLLSGIGIVLLERRRRPSSPA